MPSLQQILRSIVSCVIVQTFLHFRVLKFEPISLVLEAAVLIDGNSRGVNYVQSLQRLYLNYFWEHVEHIVQRNA